MAFYTTIGTNLKDWCEHEHKTWEEAQECLRVHQFMKRIKCQISKRTVVEVESREELEDVYGP